MVDWSLANGSNSFQSAFGFGMQLGERLRQRQDDKATVSALTGLVANPEQDDKAFAELIKGLPAPAVASAIQMRQRYQAGRADAQAKAVEQKRADLPMLIRLVENSTDEASYQRNRATAQQYGVNMDNLPQQFDPAWRDQQLVTLKALSTPEGAQALSTAGKQAVDMGYKPGTPEFNRAVNEIWSASESKPYVVGGETRLYQPKIGGQGGQVGIPTLKDPSEVSKLKPGEQFYDPNGVLRMVPQQGGPTQPASGTFQGQ